MQWKISVKKNDGSKAWFGTYKELLAFSSAFSSYRYKLILLGEVIISPPLFIQLYVYALLRASTHFGFCSFAELLHNWDTPHTEENQYIDLIYGQWPNQLLFTCCRSPRICSPHKFKKICIRINGKVFHESRMHYTIWKILI